jgi:hypothetical protein
VTRYILEMLADWISRVCNLLYEHPDTRQRTGLVLWRTPSHFCGRHITARRMPIWFNFLDFDWLGLETSFQNFPGGTWLVPSSMHSKHITWPIILSYNLWQYTLHTLYIHSDVLSHFMTFSTLPLPQPFQCCGVLQTDIRFLSAQHWNGGTEGATPFKLCEITTYVRPIVVAKYCTFATANFLHDYAGLVHAVTFPWCTRAWTQIKYIPDV